MGHIKEKVAYLQGLTRGLDVKDSSAEGKLLLNMVDVMQDVAEEIHCIHMAQEELEDYLEAVDEDLSDLENEVYEGVYDDEMVEMECPACHEVISFAADVLNEDDVVEVTCPSCGEVVYENTIEFADEDNVEMTMRRMHPGV